jgi:hypothetical protein
MFDYRKLPNPKGQVELIETIGKGNFGYVYKVLTSPSCYDRVIQ